MTFLLELEKNVWQDEYINLYNIHEKGFLFAWVKAG